jgi:hypothetical protein
VEFVSFRYQVFVFEEVVVGGYCSYCTGVVGVGFSLLWVGSGMTRAYS